MEPPDVEPEHCRVEVAMRVVGGRWKLAVLRKLLDRTHRFAELQRALPGVTARVLTRQLRELESDGLVARVVYPQVPPKVEYSPTDTGRSLDRIVRDLDAWGEWYLGGVELRGPRPRPAGGRPPDGSDPDGPPGPAGCPDDGDAPG